MWAPRSETRASHPRSQGNKAFGSGGDHDSGDSRGLEEAQKYIDDHIKNQCDAKGVDFWDYYLDPRYPEAPDNYHGYDQSVAIMAYNVVNWPQTALDKV